VVETRLYPIAKAFVLPFMLGVYILFLLTIAAAHFSGGWVVVLVDKYHEGLAELVLLSALLPLSAYVVYREVSSAIHEARYKKK